MEELPCQEEYEETRANLEKAGWSVDYIITHCVPTTIQTELLRDLSRPDHLTDFLDAIRCRCQFKSWFMGHYHYDGMIRDKFFMLYEQIIKLK